jgi:hypothetical protein
MPRRLRKIYDTTDAVELTFTTAERRFYLRPNKLVNAIIAGVVAVAAERYEVGVIAVVALSSHMHLIAKVFRDVEQQALFAQFVEANIATEINRLLGRTGPFWARRYTAIPIEGQAKLEERMAYLLGQGVKEGLVARVLHWPGLHFARAAMFGRVIKGIWYDRMKARDLRKQGKKPRRKDWTRQTELKLAPLPCWSDLSGAEQQAKVREMVQAIEAAARAERGDRPPLGVKAIEAQSPLSTPKTPRVSTPAPLVHAEGETFIRLKHAYREFKAAFRQAAELLKQGIPIEKIPFPIGCFPPRHPMVRARPSPAS